MTLWLNVCGSGGCVVRPPTSKYFIVRPPEGRCGYGSEQTREAKVGKGRQALVVDHAAVVARAPLIPTRRRDRAVRCCAVVCGRYQVLWQCCKQKGLPYRLMKPNHHTNVSISPLECEIVDEC